MPFGAFFFMRKKHLFFYGGFFLVALIYALIDPFHKDSFLPKCFIYEGLGVYCPGCGLQRALHAFFNGHFLQAFRLNFLITLAIIVLIVDFFLLLAHKENLRPVPKIISNTSWLIALCCILIVFMILRNLPFEALSFLKPI